MVTRRRTKTRRRPKPKILLDEALPPRKNFPKLNNYCDVKHVVKDFGLGGSSDEAVFEKARETNRIVATFNTRHFQRILSENPGGPSIIMISTKLTKTQIDRKLLSLIKKLREIDFHDKQFSITNC